MGSWGEAREAPEGGCPKGDQIARGTPRPSPWSRDPGPPLGPLPLPARGPQTPAVPGPPPLDPKRRCHGHHNPDCLQTAPPGLQDSPKALPGPGQRSNHARALRARSGSSAGQGAVTTHCTTSKRHARHEHRACHAPFLGGDVNHDLPDFLRPFLGCLGAGGPGECCEVPSRRVSGPLLSRPGCPLGTF